MGLSEHWPEVRAALLETTDRFAFLVASATDPEAPAIGDWSVAETAAHVAAVALIYASLFPPGAAGVPGLPDRVRAAALDEVAGLNDFMLDRLPEREPSELADRVRANVEEMLRASADLPPEQTIGWLGDSRLPVAGCCAHLLNELLIHGHDIAAATRAEWPIPQSHAALAFELFLVELLRGDTGRLLAHEPISRIPVAIRFRSRHTAPVILAVRNGRFQVAPADSPADATLFFAPATLMLLLFGRVSPVRAAATGKTVVWGRKPWRLAALLNSVRFP